MAQLLEKDQVGKRQSILDLVTNRTVTETPFTSMLAKTPEPKQTKIDYQVESYPDTASDGILDGADVTTK
ncbi:MAG: hypothetical protein OEN50_18110 [Deltaproteobacteria bacterium]|nr:hypothetical protein [Deltaproteobacteria bacterium]